MYHRFIAAGMLAAGLSFAAVTQAAEMPHIAVANLQAVVANSHHGQSVGVALQNVAKALNDKINDRRSKLDVLKKQLDKADSKSAKYAGLQKNFQDEAVNFQQFAYVSQQQYDKKKQELLQPVYDELKKVMIAYAKDHGYDIILNEDNDGAVFVTDKYDVTSELIEAMDKDWTEQQKSAAKPATDSKG